jgi:hypothetical protein
MIGRRFVAASVVIAAVAAGGVVGAVIGIPGISGASSSPTSTTTPQSKAAPNDGRHFRGFPGPSLGAGKDVLDAAAKALKLSTTDLLQKVSDGKTTIADVAKQQNVDVQTVIDAMTAVAKDDISKLVNNPLPTPFGKGGKGPGRSGMPGLGIRDSLRSSLDTVAKALGISSTDLRAALAEGQSVADIAKSKNVDLNTVIDALVNDTTSKIDAAVKAGHLSQDRATKLKSSLKEMITKALDNKYSVGGGRFGRGDRSGKHGFGPGAKGGSSAPLPMPSL